MVVATLVPLLWCVREQRRDLEAMQRHLRYVELQAAYGYSWAIDLAVSAVNDGGVKKFRHVTGLETNELGWLKVTAPDDLFDRP